MPAPDFLALHARRTPDKLAVVEDRPNGSIAPFTYAQLNADVNRLANVLQQRGVQERDKVVWCGRNSIGVIRMMNAARKLRVTAVPLNYRLTSDEAAYIVDHCDAVLVYVDEEFAPLIEEIRPRTPKMREVLVYGGADDSLLDGASDKEPEASESDDPGATMIYTSGTTGKPKGALRRGAGDPDQVRRLAELIGYVPEDVYLTTGPLYHSGPGGFMTLAQTLSNTVVVQRKFDAEDWLRLVDRYAVTTTFSAPTPIRMVCNLPTEVKARYQRGSMRRMIANAAPWSHALKQAYLADFPEDSLWEVYGSTELGVDTVLEPHDQLRKPGSCGRPAPGVEIALFDEQGKRVTEPGAQGELYVRSKTVFETYYKASDKYEEDRRGDYQTVGDIAYFDDEGYFYICDRKKDMIISGGMNIYPAEIESALEQHPRIFDAAVFGIPSEEWGESVHAVVVLTDGPALSEQEVIDFAREHLASYKIPRSVSFTHELPRTGSGKLLKRVLREPYWKGHESQVS